MRSRVFQDDACGHLEEDKMTRCPYATCCASDGAYTCVAYIDGDEDIPMPLREVMRDKPLHQVVWKLKRCPQCLAEVLSLHE